MHPRHPLRWQRERCDRGLWGGCSCDTPATHSELRNEPRQGCSYTVERDRGGCSVCPTTTLTSAKSPCLCAFSRAIHNNCVPPTFRHKALVDPFFATNAMLLVQELESWLQAFELFQATLRQSYCRAADTMYPPRSKALLPIQKRLLTYSNFQNSFPSGLHDSYRIESPQN